MKKAERSRLESQIQISLEELRIKLCFKEEVEENNLFLAAGLTYFFGVLFACLTEVVERYFGVVLILTAIMIVWYLRDKRKEIRRKFEKEIESLSKGERKI